MPYPNSMNPAMMQNQNPYGMQNPYVSQTPSPYQQSMMGGNPYAKPMQAPRDNSFAERQAAIGQQLSTQSAQNAGGSTAGMSSGFGGALGGGALGAIAGSGIGMGGLATMDPKMLAAGLRKLGGAVSPYLPTTQQATADQFNTNPYSEQSLMLAKQNQGLV